MLQVAVYGYGNIGQAVVQAVQASSDCTVTGVVSSRLQPGALGDIPVVRNIDALSQVDVVILCTPSRTVPDLAANLLAKGLCTVDSFDIHTEIVAVRRRLDVVAKEHGTAAIVAAGWDPGTDSVVRTLFEAMAPHGLTYTDFGPGMSMGHTVAVKAIPGVKDALSLTIPLGTGIHRRMVYVELAEGYTLEEVAAAVKSDAYFVHDETHVLAVDDVCALRDMGHGVHLERKGVSGSTHSQRLSFTMAINNPALTGQVLVSAARAVKRQVPGCYTLIEIPPVDLLDGDRDGLVRRLV